MKNKTSGELFGLAVDEQVTGSSKSFTNFNKQKKYFLNRNKYL